MESLFFTLFIQLLPLYVCMGLGFVAGRWIGVDRESIARLMIYIIVPVVFLGGVSEMRMDWTLLLIPLLTYGMAVVVGLSTYRFSKAVYGDSRANIMAQASGTGNNGYFGLPVAFILFDTQTVGVYLLGVIGISLFESSIGFYLTARGEYTPRDSFIKVLRLPMLYAFIAGSFISFSEFSLPGIFYEGVSYFKGAYTILGMMMIGLGLSSMQRFRIDLGFTSILFVAKFVAWPVLALALMYLDTVYLQLFSENVRQAMLLISIMPLAANTVAIASMLKCHPERTATTVLLSTLFGLGYVPFMVGWILN